MPYAPGWLVRSVACPGSRVDEGTAAQAGIRNRFAAGIVRESDFSVYVSADFRYLYPDGHPFLQTANVKAGVQGQPEAQLFRILRNARGADRLNPLGAIATQGGQI